MKGLSSLAALLFVWLPPAFAQHDADVRLMREMARADLAEVEVGKLAAQKAASAEVKKFAQQMIEEHSKHLDELRGLAQSQGEQLPPKPGRKHEEALKKLHAVSGAQFDRAYMAKMVRDHRETLKKVHDAARKAKDRSIRASAKNAAAVMQKHLETAKSILDSLE